MSHSPSGGRASLYDEYLSEGQPAEGSVRDDLGKKVTTGEPYAESSFDDPLQAHITRMDEERAATVLKRRQNVNQVQRVFARIVPYGGILSSGLNLASSSIGAGIIAQPAAFRASGIVMALIYLVVVAVLTVYSHTLLARAAIQTGLRNYEEIVNHLMGPFGAYLLAFCLWFLSFGAEVSYTLSLDNSLQQFLDNSQSTPSFLRKDRGRNLLTAAVWLVCMLPLCIPREINSLRYFSFVAILFIIFFVICMIVHFGQTMSKTGLRDDYVIIQTGNTAIMGLGSIMFAFINQLNMMEIFGEQYKPSVKRMTLSAVLGTVLCFFLYTSAGLFGYLDFGGTVPDTALKLYNPIADPLFAVSYVGIMLKLCVGYGMHMIPVRDATYFAFGTNVKAVPFWLNTIVVTFWAVVSLIGGLFIPRITLVFGLVGGFAGGFIGFIFPSLMYMYTGNWTLRTVSYVNYFGSYFLLIVGVIGVCFGTASAIYGEVGN